MPQPRHIHSPDDLSSAQRRTEIAAIFARGCRRLAEDRQILGESGEKSADSAATCLDFPNTAALMDEPVDGTGERRVVPCP